MRILGLIVSYKNGVNSIFNRRIMSHSDYPVGYLLCRIFQGETLDNISRILCNCINECPMAEEPLTQDSIEEAERYILTALLYDDFYPAQALAQGSFIRCMENYRALDSESMVRFWHQELERVHTEPMLFTNIGFDTVGNYLRLCFNNYYIDLCYAVDLFSSMAAVKSDTATGAEKDRYKELCESLNCWGMVPGIEMQTISDPNSMEFSYRFIISSFLAMAVFEFTHIEEATMKIIRCQNPDCGKFFIAKRSSAKYCDFPAPQARGRTCHDYYPQFVYRTKLQNNELDHLVKNASSRLYMSKIRHPENATEISALISTLQIEAPHKKQAVMENKMTITKFREWLNTLRCQKGAPEYE